MSEEDEDKQHEPTQKKLDDARKKGEVVRSTDLTTAASYAGFLLAAFGFGANAVQDFGVFLTVLISQSWNLAPQLFLAGSAWGGGIILQAILGNMLWFLMPAALVLVVIAVQRSFVVAPDKIVPKLSRISVISNAKNKFGRSGLFEFAKSTVKLCLYSVVLGFYLVATLPEILGSAHLPPGLIGITLARLTLSFLLIVLLIAVGLGAIDYLWQYFEHQRKNRMSHQELKDEAKQSDGDPHVKQQRRQRAQEIAMNQMLLDVPKADVIVVNPTHYAVALRWSRAPNTAPECVAKGTDNVAERIRNLATENGVPIHSDPPTARALFAAVEVGQEIRPDQYRAVAAAIRAADIIRRADRERNK